MISEEGLVNHSEWFNERRFNLTRPQGFCTICATLWADTVKSIGND